MVATLATSSFVLIGSADFNNSDTTNFTARCIPFLTRVGFAPAVIFFNASSNILYANTVEVVVESPTESLVFEATSLISFAPSFSNGSSNTKKSAIETPSSKVTELYLLP